METAKETVSTVENQVKEITALLSKAAKNYQMYLPNNRMFISSRDAVKKALDGFLEENDILTFVVKEFELIHEDVPVYVNMDRHQSIAFRMYRDGVRLLSFHKGLSDDELLAFFEALTRCMEIDNSEEDFVTLLWGRDLQAITYYEVNEFEADYERVEKSSKDTQVNAVPLKPDFRQEHPRKVSEDVERLKPALSLSARDVEEVRGLAIAVDDDLFLRRAWHVLSYTLKAEEAKDSYVDFENGLIGFLDTCVAKRQLGMAADALASIRQQYDQSEVEEVAQTLRRIVESRYTERNMEVIGEILTAGREVEQVQCLAYLSRLSCDAIPSILSLLPGCTRQSAKQTVIAALASLGSSCPAEMMKGVDEARSDDVEVVLDVLDMIGTDAALESAMQLRHHAAPRVRARVASLAGSLKTDLSQRIVHDLLNDEDQSVRRRAVVSLVKIGGEKCAAILTELYTSKEFGLLPHNSKRSMLLVARNLSPSGQRQVTQAVFGMRNLLKKRPVEDTKAALGEIMHLMNREVAAEILPKVVSKSSGGVRKILESAVERLDRAGKMR
jgi:hypothetical protein